MPQSHVPKTCPTCGRPVAEEDHCRFCDTSRTPPAPRKPLSSDHPGADYGVFLLAVPLIAVVGLVIVALAAHSIPGMVWIMALTAIITGGYAASEVFQSPAAWNSGSPLKPMFGWFGLVTVIWPVGYPFTCRSGVASCWETG